MKRLAVVCDYAEEGWASMDLVGEKILRHCSRDFEATRIRPDFRRRLGFIPRVGAKADRAINRFLDYPAHLRSRAGRFDAFHVCDHSYAHLVHSLPAERTGVFLHDLDAFRCVLEPQREPRGPLFRSMARRILSGLRKAAVVFYGTEALRNQALRHGLVDAARLVRVNYGISDAFVPVGEGVPFPFSELGASPFILHVGLCIPRKRIDLLLEIFAGLRERVRDLRLVQVGGEWTAEQRAMIDRLGLGPSVHQFSRRTHPALESEEVLAAVYRRAELLLMPSEAEGFGLPVLEALGCGRPVLASDLPPLREAGGDAAVYAPVGDVSGWVERASTILKDPAKAPAPQVRLAHARRFSWPEHAEAVCAAYRRLLR